MRVVQVGPQQRRQLVAPVMPDDVGLRVDGQREMAEQGEVLRLHHHPLGGGGIGARQGDLAEESEAPTRFSHDAKETQEERQAPPWADGAQTGAGHCDDVGHIPRVPPFPPRRRDRRPDVLADPPIHSTRGSHHV